MRKLQPKFFVDFIAFNWSLILFNLLVFMPHPLRTENQIGRFFSKKENLILKALASNLGQKLCSNLFLSCH